MDIKVTDEKIYFFKEQLSFEQAEENALSKKLDAFGTVLKFTSFLQKPKDEEFELSYKEARFEPFWYVVCDALYVYDRKTSYQWALSGSEVKEVTFGGNKYSSQKGVVNIDATDHCRQEDHVEIYMDGVTGERNPTLASYLKFSSTEVPKEKIEKHVPKGAIVVPPKIRISALVREVLAKSIQSIQADKIFEENVELKNVDLYYRPVYAFRFSWKSKAKEAIIEIDGLTGQVKVGNRTFEQYLGKVLDKDFLFDLGADAAGIVLPGGSIAVKIAKKYMDSKK
ncbi:hypothetical protein A2716_05275 [candidate division WWE3 bacterium RIFCSPHIGHO2_01_FULL_40_23]|uniref:Uncharacterized protein n=1 Tax=candidate division WWE3 bacterium RIFCSPLOWO2_01_FULL_41_18 TaxID=1802625 RepID=A0A1F4VEB3_UNCKA|nr:MAG: hypothetical protein A2716_05275 [candidate division WWE3 bacterium RIFCSPHIGHO2_01_FULL_40_23]OGC55280.1 MAG: hypothetical protein A3A78_04885 [candidate division WWE3 bacterium RIFCSPLOWO2_01_FULL_41_18]